jgi:hypothetical protein
VFSYYKQRFFLFRFREWFLCRLFPQKRVSGDFFAKSANPAYHMTFFFICAASANPAFHLTFLLFYLCRICQPCLPPDLFLFYFCRIR